MSAVARLAAFLGALVAVFVASFAVGAAIGPEPTAPEHERRDEHELHGTDD